MLWVYAHKLNSNIKMKLTIITDNYVNKQKLRAEHGLSFLIEEDNHKILLDCGQSDLVLSNAKVLGIDLNKITEIVLSHGHYDHTGGLLPVLKYLDREIDIYAHPLIFEEKYSKYRGFNGFNEHRYIGIPDKKQVYEKNGARFLLSSDTVYISDNIYLSGQISKDNSINNNPDNNEAAGNSFFIKQGNSFIRDPLFDDISVFMDLPDLLLIITGCAHSGILNILKKAEEIKTVKKEIAIIGGMHLLNSKKEHIDIIVSKLQKYNIKLIVPSHCSGINAFVQLKNTFGDRCIFGSTGKILEL